MASGIYIVHCVLLTLGKRSTVKVWVESSGHLGFLNQFLNFLFEIMCITVYGSSALWSLIAESVVSRLLSLLFC